jgi:hypothetical protein
MRAAIRFLTISRRVGAVAALWLMGAGTAWAGDGADLGSLQSYIGPPNGSSGLCHTFGMNPCPQLPTVTQAVLEIAGLAINLPEIVRAQNNIPAGSSVTAGNSTAILAGLPDATSVSVVLSTLTPLAFISQGSGTAKATQLYDPRADTFLYAVGVSATGLGIGLPEPNTVYFFYEDLGRTGQNFATGSVVAKFSFPLTVLYQDNNGVSHERAVPTTLNFIATNAGDCSMSTVVGDFNGSGTPQTLNPPSAIGIDCAVVFSASPTSTQKHAIFEVSVQLLVTGASPPPNTDPAYFYSLLHQPQENPVNTGVFTAFVFNDANGKLGQGASIGLAPTAAPLCSTLFPNFNGACPSPAPSQIPFALCATLPDNTNGTGAKLRPAVGTYYAIATSGETLVSAPLASASTSAPCQ